jgi:hypothetical protein
VTIGAALGSIIATIITAHIRKVSHSAAGDHAEGIDIPGIPAMLAIPAMVPIAAPLLPADMRHKYSQASAESAPRPPQIASRSGSLSVRAILRLSVVGAAEAIAGLSRATLSSRAKR